MNGPTPSTTTTTTSAAAVIAHNDDLLMELLLLLPAKSLIRFKSVCKHWRSLISGASFSHLHTLRHRKPQSSLLLHVSRPQFFYFNPSTKKLVPFHFKFAPAKIRQSCHGLFLLECGYAPKDFYIYNPTTGESRDLLLKKGFFLGLHLAFDPSESPHYKVVCLRTKSYSIYRDFEIEIYDSQTHRWNRREKVYPAPSPPLHSVLYWKNCIYSIASDSSVVCFDIENDTYRTPPRENFSIRHCAGGLTMFSLVEPDGRVHYIAYNNVTNYLVVCEITEKDCVCDGSLKYIPEFNDDFAAASCAMIRDQICFVGVIRGEREDESLVFLFPGKIMVYRMFAGRLEELVELRAQEFYRQYGYLEAYQFIESLAPV